MRAAIVSEARGLLGTPYHAHQRTAGVGIDCAGVPIVVAKRLGLVGEDFDVNGYTLFPDGQLLTHCRAHMDEKPLDSIQAGDVAVVSWGAGDAQHFGIVADHPTYPGVLSLIHASNDKRHMGVIEHRLAFDRHIIRR